MWLRVRETTGVGEVVVEEEEAGAAMRVAEEVGEDLSMTGDLQGEMTGEEEGGMVEEMEVTYRLTI